MSARIYNRQYLHFISFFYLYRFRSFDFTLFFAYLRVRLSTILYRPIRLYGTYYRSTRTGFFRRESRYMPYRSDRTVAKSNLGESPTVTVSPCAMVKNCLAESCRISRTRASSRAGSTKSSSAKGKVPMAVPVKSE
jgi:hypothetical protein